MFVINLEANPAFVTLQPGGERRHWSTGKENLQPSLDFKNSVFVPL